MSARCPTLLLAACCILAGCAAPTYPFKLTDVRTETRFGDARTTVRGAEVILDDDAIAPALVDRLAEALKNELGDRLAGKNVRIEKALAVLVVDDARVAPSTLLRRGGALPVLRDVSLTAQKHISIDYAGTVDGRPFIGHGEEHYRLGDGSTELSRAIGVALRSAVNGVRADLP